MKARSDVLRAFIMQHQQWCCLFFCAWPNAHMLHPVSSATGTSAFAANLVPVLEKGRKWGRGSGKMSCRPWKPPISRTTLLRRLQAERHRRDRPKGSPLTACLLRWMGVVVLLYRQLVGYDVMLLWCSKFVQLFIKIKQIFALQSTMQHVLWVISPLIRVQFYYTDNSSELCKRKKNYCFCDTKNSIFAKCWSMGRKEKLLSRFLGLLRI